MTGSILDTFNQVDALISDVSSVIPDFLYSEKPFALTSMAAETTTAEFLADFPLARAGYLLALGSEQPGHGAAATPCRRSGLVAAAPAQDLLPWRLSGRKLRRWVPGRRAEVRLGILRPRWTDWARRPMVEALRSGKFTGQQAAEAFAEFVPELAGSPGPISRALGRPVIAGN